MATQTVGRIIGFVVGGGAIGLRAVSWSVYPRLFVRELLLSKRMTDRCWYIECPWLHLPFVLLSP